VNLKNVFGKAEDNAKLFGAQVAVHEITLALQPSHREKYRGIKSESQLSRAKNKCGPGQPPEPHGFVSILLTASHKAIGASADGIHTLSNVLPAHPADRTIRSHRDGQRRGLSIEKP
jgi:hypothetical protein